MNSTFATPTKLRKPAPSPQARAARSCYNAIAHERDAIARARVDADLNAQQMQTLRDRSAALLAQREQAKAAGLAQAA